MSSSKYDDKIYTPEPPSSQSQEVKYISFSVFGIREPGQQIKHDVIKTITKKLDYNTLDLINQYIARNPKCKLTPKDVEVNVIVFVVYILDFYNSNAQSKWWESVWTVYKFKL